MSINPIAKHFYFVVILLMLSGQCLAASSTEDYRLGVGDTIHINVYDESDLTVEVRIGKSGTITFPFLNTIDVLGKTTEQVAEVITQGLLGDYLIDPHVNVNIVSYRPFFIHGEVRRPGGYAYQIGLTLDKAVALAGGFTERASSDNWLILRELDGNQVEMPAALNTELEPDDIIKIGKSFF